MAERNFCLSAIVIIALQLDLSFGIPLVKDTSSSGECETLNLKNENSIAPDVHQMVDPSSAHLIRKKRTGLPLPSVTDQAITPLGYGTAKTSFHLNSEITNTDVSNELDSTNVVHQENSMPSTKQITSTTKFVHPETAKKSFPLNSGITNTDVSNELDSTNVVYQEHSTPSTNQISSTTKFVHPGSSLKKEVTEVKEKPRQEENLTTKSNVDKEQLKKSTSTGDKGQLKQSASTGEKEQQKADENKDNMTVEHHKVLQLVNSNIENVISPSEATVTKGKLTDADTGLLLTNYLNTEEPSRYLKSSNSDGIDFFFINETDALKPITPDQSKSDLDRAIPISDIYIKPVDLFWMNFFSNLNTNYTISSNMNSSKEDITLLPVKIELTTKFFVKNDVESSKVANKNESLNLVQKDQRITEFSTKMTTNDVSNTKVLANETSPLKLIKEGEISIPKITEFTTGMTVKDNLVKVATKTESAKMVRESTSSMLEPTSGFTTDLSIKKEFEKGSTITNKKEFPTMSTDVSSSPNTINPLQEPKLNYVPLSRNVLQMLELHDIFSGIPLFPAKFVQVDKSSVRGISVETTTDMADKNVETVTTAMNKKTLHKTISEDVSSTPKTDVYQIFKLKSIQLFENGLNLPEIKDQVNSINLPTEMLVQETTSSLSKAVKFTTVNTPEDSSKNATKVAKETGLPKMVQKSIVPGNSVKSTTAMTSKDGLENATKVAKKTGLPKLGQESVVPGISTESTEVAKKKGFPKLGSESVVTGINTESTKVANKNGLQKLGQDSVAPGISTESAKVAKKTGFPKSGQESLLPGISTESTTDTTVKNSLENSTKRSVKNIIQKDVSSRPLISPVILQMSEMQELFRSIHYAPSTGDLEQREKSR